MFVQGRCLTRMVGSRATDRTELDPPAEGEVSVRVAACGVCHSDLSFAEGAWDGPLPAVYGHEVAGVVTKVGAGVESVEPGDHAIVTLIRSCGRCYFCMMGEVTQCSGVFDIDQRSALRLADGSPVRQGLHVAGFADHVTVHGSQVVRIPRDVPLDSACLPRPEDSMAPLSSVSTARCSRSVRTSDAITRSTK